jgi:hypothetical protein
MNIIMSSAEQGDPYYYRDSCYGMPHHFDTITFYMKIRVYAFD